MADQPTAPQQPTSGGNDAEENKMMAVLAYIGILVLVPLLAAKDSKFAQYHAKQGLALFIAEVVIGLVGIIPFIGWLVMFVGFLACLVLAIMGIMNALNGKEKELPLLGPIAKKLNF
ncbi:MAG: DUF4870 domain-containing protein [Candidatus Kerfeldbacteria bacterium]